jgi:colanic acid/amylovoran biosynthesis glycosyltransferase
MRIAVVTGRFPAWSVTFILDQITYALDHDCDVEVYASRPGEGAQHTEVERYDLARRTHYFPRTRHDLPRVPRSARVWAKLIRHPRIVLRALPHVRGRIQLEDLSGFLPRSDYDVVHCHFAPNAARVLPALRAGVLRGKLLATFHGYDILKAQPGDYAELFASDAFYTSNTNFLKQRAVELGCPEARIVRFPMGVDTKKFQVRAPDTSQKPPKLLILTVARLVEFKGIEFGLRAFAKIAGDFPDARYEILGDGPLRAELEALAVQLGIADLVTFRGAATRDEVVQAFGAAQVFLLPGIVDAQGQCEAQGVVLIEAQACGVPIVASRIGGIPEAVGADSGVLVEPKDVTGLAGALATVLGDADRRAAMASAGPTFVTEQFDQERLNARLLAIYEAVAHGRHPGEVGLTAQLH